MGNTGPDHQPGWTKTSNARYRDELKQLREQHKRDGPKNSGKKCDHCTMDEHHLCGRVGCYCPCYKEYYNGQTYRTVVPSIRDSSDLES